MVFGEWKERLSKWTAMGEVFFGKDLRPKRLKFVGCRSLAFADTESRMREAREIDWN